MGYQEKSEHHLGTSPPLLGKGCAFRMYTGELYHVRQDYDLVVLIWRLSMIQGHA